jgi:uncharacterized membrane protein YeiH
MMGKHARQTEVRMKIFGREPTLLLQGISAVLAFFVTFGWDKLTGEQAGLIVAVIAAVIGTINALMVRPVAPAVFDTAIKAGAALLAGYGLNLGQEHVGAFQLAVIAVVTWFLRDNVTPAASPALGGGVSSKDVPELAVRTTIPTR